MKFCFDVKDFIEVDINAKKLAVIGDDFELTWEAFRAKVNETADFLKTQNLFTESDEKHKKRRLCAKKS